MPRLGGAAFIAVVLAVLAMGRPAHADSAVDRAKAAIDQSDYMAARTALAEALAAGTSGPQQLAEIYRLSGVVAGALGEAKAAEEAFTRCLALDPKATLPVGTSPKIAKPFGAAQAYFKKQEPLRIKTETTADPPAVTVIVASDPLAMIARVRATVVVDGKPEKVLERPGSERTTIQLPAGQRLDLRVAALDDKGNRVAELGSTDVPIVIVAKGAPALVVTVDPKQPNQPPKPRVVDEKPVKQRPLYLRWWLWGGAAVVFGGAGIYFGIDALRAKSDLDALNAESSNHSFDEALALEDHARRSVLFANIGMITGGVFAAGATVLFLIRPREPRERRPVARIAPVVHANGGGFVLGGEF